MANTPLNPDFTDFIDTIATQWSAIPAGRCILAAGFSGGLDSTVLLHVLCRLRERVPLQLHAIHVHHGLSRYADDWADFCRQTCRAWHVPLQIKRVQVAPAGQGVEAAARAARYAVFSGNRADVVALAHHRDDQIETFFLGALRGGGLRALAAMPARRALSDSCTLWRPLLAFSRQQLQAYATHFQLSHIDDDSNSDTTLQRNWLRLSGLPAWRARFAHLDEQVAAAVARVQEELALVDEVCRDDSRFISQNGYFDIRPWRTLSPLRQQQQLRRFAQQHNLGSPRAASIAEFARQLNIPDCRTAEWRLPQGRAVYYYPRLWPVWADNQAQWPWLAGLPCDTGCLKKQQADDFVWQHHDFGLPEPQTHYRVRITHPTDTLQLLGGHKNVQKILQERRIPAFLRHIWPVLSDEYNQCLAVFNIAVATDHSVAQGYLPCLRSLPLHQHSD